MVDATQGLGLDQIADVVNRQNVGTSQRARNEMIRAGVQSPDSFALQNQSSIQQAQQPSEISSGLSSLYNQPSSTSQQQPQTPSYPDMWSSITPTSFSGTGVRGTHTNGVPNDLDTKYNTAVQNAKVLSQAGFTSGNSPSGWSYTPLKERFSGSEVPRWLRGDDHITYDPKRGYTIGKYSDSFDSDDLQSIALVASIAGGIILPGLGVGLGSGAGAAGGAEGGTGLVAPTSTAGSVGGGALGNGITGSIATAGSGVSSAGLGQGITAGLAQAAPTIGSTLSSIFASNNGVLGTGYSTGSSLADSAIQNFVKSSAMSGGDIKGSLLNTLAGLGGGYVNTNVSSALKPYLGDIASKMFGGAASGGLNSLFTGNSPIAGSLYGGMSGGLHGFLNSTASGTDTFNKDMDNRNKLASQQMSKLAKTILTRK